MVTNRSQCDADAPSAIPLGAWWEVWRRALRRASYEGLLTEAAGVAFCAVFALFAGLVALVSLWGLFANPGMLGHRVHEIERALPAGLPELLQQLIAAAAPGRGAAAIVAALWAASGAAQALLRGLNLDYGERECRGFWYLTGVSLVVALCGAAFTLLALAAFLALPLTVGEGTAAGILRVLRWPALIAAAAFGLTVLYRNGPCRAEPRWRWVSWGGGFAALTWVAGSAGFSWYVRDLGGYDAAYGPLSAVVVFMTWAWLSAAAVLMGAVLNAEAEGQTTHDTAAVAGGGARGAQCSKARSRAARADGAGARRTRNASERKPFEHDTLTPRVQAMVEASRQET